MSNTIQTIQIAIDGPAGAGKSSVVKVLSKRLGCIYLVTGAMYRAVTWAAMGQNIDFDDTEAIRTPEISANVSAVSMIPAVRESMTDKQRRIAEGHDVLMDG
ncbi:MAG: (d)CMP kinase, partial [Peptococcaceae bacterium]|nr:(d)CMP kinase [Peptococcaceae bacterium]